MTTSDGDLPVGETVDIEAALQEVTADDAAGDGQPMNRRPTRPLRRPTRRMRNRLHPRSRLSPKTSTRPSR